MKKLLFFFVMILGMVSCVGDSGYIASEYCYGVAYLSDENPFGYRVLLDYGVIVDPISVPAVADGEAEYLPIDNERVYLYLEVTDPLVGTVDADIMFIEKLPSSDILVANEIDADTLGIDPIYVDKDYVYLTQSFLNVSYTYLKASDNLVTHDVYLVHYPDSVSEDGCEYFKLHHNANGDLQENYADGYQCFDMRTLDAFAEGSDSVTFSIKLDAGSSDDASNIYEGTYYKPYLEQ